MNLPSVELYNATVSSNNNITAVGSPLSQGTGSGEYQVSYDAMKDDLNYNLMNQYQLLISYALELIS